MPQETHIETVFVTEVATSTTTITETENLQHLPSDLTLELVYLPQFIELYKKHHHIDDRKISIEQIEQFEENIVQLWKCILGNNPDRFDNNPLISCLTKESCLELLTFEELISTSGLDLTHLPTGFFFARNTLEHGACTVLHYSDFLKKHKPASSLAIVLSKKPDLIENFEPNPYQNEDANKAIWYDFLRSKIQSGGITHCTEDELKKAFITFSERVKNFGLAFFDTPTLFDKLKDQVFNPITLLGRWYTVLTQPALKYEDREEQFKALPLLPLHEGYNALRVITDHQRTPNPCGFLLPAMFSANGDRPRYVRFDTKNLQDKTIPIIMRFWCHIAHQPKRNSIQYYKDGLKEIDDLGLLERIRLDLELGLLESEEDWNNQVITLLATSTTDKAHLAHTKKDEQRDTEYWKNYCEIIKSLPGIMLGFLNTLKPILGETLVGQGIHNVGANFQDVFIKYTASLETPPNIAFLHSLALYIQHYLEEVSIIREIISVTRQQKGKIIALEDLGDQLNSVVSRANIAFYRGARFYFINDTWIQLGINEYIKLQYVLLEDYISQKRLPLICNYGDATSEERDSIRKKLAEYEKIQNLLTYISPLFSTFSISTPEELNAICEKIIDTYYHILNIATVNNDSQILNAFEKDFQFCLRLFENAITPCDADDLFLLIDEIKKLSHTPQTLLEYIEKNFSAHFEPNYFAEEKKKLSSSPELNEQQKKDIAHLGLTPEQTALLTQIEFSLLCNDPHGNNHAALTAFNECCYNLKVFIDSDDLTFLLDKINDTLSKEQQTFTNANFLILLAGTIINKGDIVDFKQIYYFNQIEKSTSNLLEKFVFYINNVKSITLSSKIPQQVAYELVARLILNAFSATNTQTEKDALADTIKQQFTAIANHIKENPHLTKYLLEASKQLPKENYLTNIANFATCLTKIQSLLTMDSTEEAINQHNLLFYHLLVKFCKKPLILIAFIDQIDQLACSPGQKKSLIQLFKSSISDDSDLSKLKELLQDESAVSVILPYCDKPPYPSIDTLTQWICDSKNESVMQAKYAHIKFRADTPITDHCKILKKVFLEETQNDFDKRPYGNRRLDFTFNRTHFETQRKLFQGQKGDIFTDELGNKLHITLSANREKSVSELTIIFNQLREKAQKQALNTEEKLKLLCTCIELLARTASQKDDTGRIISQELNTTQVMALYAKLVHQRKGSKLISEISTSGGKSRINMVLTACQVAMNKTVDFMTSDMMLAERDFLSYNAFFDTLGIRTSLISLDTPKQLYQKGGVNFTDNRQLLLLRNRSDIEQDSYAYLDEDEERRCLISDEVDNFIHDSATNSFNYAAASETLKRFTWIYPLIVKFVREKIKENPSVEIPTLAEQFSEFVFNNDTNDSHRTDAAYLQKNHEQQLITWLNAAYTALHLKNDSNYTITPAADDKLFTVRDAEENLRLTRKVLVVDSGRPVEGATFSLGVHQCVCPIENEKTQNESFIIPPENVTQRSSYPATFIQLYDKGAFFGASGTSRHEVYSESPFRECDYLIVPREKKLRLDEKNIWLARNEIQQTQFLKGELHKYLNKKPQHPVLIICENDEQSQRIFNFIQQAKFTATRVHSLTEKEEEIAAINNAGNPGQITISTAGMFGRGVDIHTNHDLVVLSLYVPSFSDETQIKGRTARNGKNGIFRIIPNMSNPKCPIKGNTYHTEKEIRKIQETMAVQAIQEEQLEKLWAEFQENVHQAFFKSRNENPRILLSAWADHLRALQQDWNITRKTLLGHLKNSDMHQFNGSLLRFTNHWTDATNKFLESPHIFIVTKDMKDKAAKAYHHLTQNRLFPAKKAGLIKIQHHYDVADPGQARIYNSLFEHSLATLCGERPLFANCRAWLDDRGVLFPDLRASLSGERPLFANLLATIRRLLTEFNAWFNNPKIQKNDITRHKLTLG